MEQLFFPRRYVFFPLRYGYTDRKLKIQSMVAYTPLFGVMRIFGMDCCLLGYLYYWFGVGEGTL
jgi:hypothetical protein